MKKGTVSSTLPRKPKMEIDLTKLEETGHAKWKVVVTIEGETVYWPQYQTEGSACADLVANLEVPVEIAGMVPGTTPVAVENHEGKSFIRLYPQQTYKIDCGFSMALPLGWEAQIRARSSLALKGLVVPNGPGTIDSDYRGRVSMMLTNTSKNILTIEHRQRIGQIALKPVYLFAFEPGSLDETARGTGGFGNTGETV